MACVVHLVDLCHVFKKPMLPHVYVVSYEPHKKILGMQEFYGTSFNSLYRKDCRAWFVKQRDNPHFKNCQFKKNILIIHNTQQGAKIKNSHVVNKLPIGIFPQDLTRKIFITCDDQLMMQQHLINSYQYIYGSEWHAFIPIERRENDLSAFEMFYIKQYEIYKYLGYEMLNLKMLNLV
jgi:hypothetical protein